MPVGASSRVTRKAGIPELENFATDVDDPAEAALFHTGQDLLQQQQRRLYEELQLIAIGTPGLLLDGEEWLGTCRGTWDI